MALKVSLYVTPDTWRDNITNTGYDYEGNILANTLSAQLYKDPVRAAMISKMEPVLFELVESVKLVKTIMDPLKSKYYRKFN